MPLIRYALAAAAASLIGGLAYAQGMSQGAPSDESQPAPPADTSSAQAPPADNAAVAQTGVRRETSATVDGRTVTVVSNAPIPDTPENRAKFGQPMSRAGKRTKPAGN